MKDTDSVFDEIEAEWCAEEETRSGGSKAWQAEDETRGAEDSEEEDWRITQWEENDEPIYERG